MAEAMMDDQDVIDQEHPIVFQKENVRTLKHRKDFCATNLSSKRSENVKNLSLDDIIAERNIAAPPKKDKRVDFDLSTDEVDLGLNDIIKKRSLPITGRRNIERSLDDIIKESKAKTGKNGNQDGSGIKEEPMDSENGIGSSGSGFSGRKRKLDEDEDDDIYYASPVDVIHSLSEEGFIIENEIGKRKERGDSREHNWRVTFKCGELKVVVDSARKILAKEAAAFEFLKRLKTKESSLKIPPFRIPEACFYDAVVCERLEQVTTSMGVGIPRYETIQTMKCRREYYTTTYYVGEDEFVGAAYSIDHSKILAAKSAYETYSGKKFHRDAYIIGEKNCLDGLIGTDFKLLETEATHILTLDPGVSTLDVDVKHAEEAEEEEVLVDDSGRMFVRSGDGSNKIRRLARATLDEILEEKILQMAVENISSAGVGGGIENEEDEDDY